MIDFDDLEEVALERHAAGELDEVAAMALGKVEAPDPFKGGLLWPIPRNKQFPDIDVLPVKMRESFPNVRKAIRMRLFCFYGAGDSYPFWAQFLQDVPEWVDAVVYEWPSHGSRDDEQLPDHVDGVVSDAMEGLEASLKQHAKGAALEGAPFALLGHSIGVLLMLGVAARAKSLYGLEPAAAFVLDRAAPQHGLCSEHGLEILEADAADFIRIFNPQPWMMHQNALASQKRKGITETSPPVSEAGDREGNVQRTRRMLQMWMDDIKLQNHVKPEGWHLFKCPLHIFVAMKNWVLDNMAVEAKAKLDPEMQKWHGERQAILNSKEGSSALWEYSKYEDWQRWATVGQCHLHNIDAEHTEIRRRKEFLDIMWDVLRVLKTAD